MRAPITLLIIALLSACNAPQSQNPNRETDIQALTYAKVEAWRALYRKGDAEGLANFLNDDFIFIPGDGEAITKQDEVDYVRNNPPNMPDDFLYHVDNIIFTGSDTAIVYGKGHSTRTNENGESCAHTYWSSNSFKRVDGRWRPSFSHVSGAKCE